MMDSVSFKNFQLRALDISALTANDPAKIIVDELFIELDQKSWNKAAIGIYQSDKFLYFTLLVGEEI